MKNQYMKRIIEKYEYKLNERIERSIRKQTNYVRGNETVSQFLMFDVWRGHRSKSRRVGIGSIYLPDLQRNGYPILAYIIKPASALPALESGIHDGLFPSRFSSLSLYVLFLRPGKRQ
jgi:hypothetical protein